MDKARSSRLRFTAAAVFAMIILPLRLAMRAAVRLAIMLKAGNGDRSVSVVDAGRESWRCWQLLVVDVVCERLMFVIVAGGIVALLPRTITYLGTSPKFVNSITVCKDHVQIINFHCLYAPT